MANKLIHCKACGAEIASSAKSCPHCGARNKKPIYKRWWFWLLVVLVVLIGIGSSGSSEDTSPGKTPSAAQDASAAPEAGTNANEVSAAEEALEEEPEVQTVFYPGDTLETNDLTVAYLECGDFETEDYFPPEEGMKVVYLTFEFENISSGDTLVSYYDFTCFADGYSCDSYIWEKSLSADLSSGRKVTGSVYFQVPEDAQDIEVEYETNFWTEEKVLFLVE